MTLEERLSWQWILYENGFVIFGLMGVEEGFLHTFSLNFILTPLQEIFVHIYDDGKIPLLQPILNIGFLT